MSAVRPGTAAARAAVPEGHRSSATIALFASASTLLCCALPALLVSVGAGATLASLVGAVPQLVWLSEHKVALFAGSAATLALAGALQWRARSLPCPIDPARAAACTRARRLSLRIWWASAAVWAVGALFAFVLPVLAV